MAVAVRSAQLLRLAGRRAPAKTFATAANGAGHHAPRGLRGPKQKLAAVAGPIDVPLLQTTIAEEFAKTVARHGQRPALISSDQPQYPPGGAAGQFHATYSDLDVLSTQFARGLRQLGLQKGDRLGVWLPNTWQYTVAQVAAAKLGVILVTVNPGYRASEAEYALHLVGVKAVLITPKVKSSDYVAILNELIPELPQHTPTSRLNAQNLPDLEYIISIADQPAPGMLAFNDLLVRRTTPLQEELGDLLLQPDDPINIQFTSGTTGNPKAATLSHRNILNNGYFVGRGLALAKEDAICIPVPLYHCFGLVMGNLAAMTHGAAMVYPAASFDPAKTLQAVQEHKCTVLYGVPTMFIAELTHPQFNTFDLSTLRTGIMAGSVCPMETMRAVMTRMHLRDMTICYGMTETSPVSFQTLLDDPIQLRVETVGKCHPHVSCRVVDEHGRTVPVNTPGELLTKGYSVMLGYWGDEHKTREAIRDAWMHTGDQATIDEHGYCRIVGRIKDLIIRGGENISPREIEDLLFTHDRVTNVAVVGVPDPFYGEAVAAWIITKKAPGQTRPPVDSHDDCTQPAKEGDAASDLARELQQFCRERTAHYKVPRYFIFTDEFPLTVTGKIQKFILRDRAVDVLRLHSVPPAHH